MLCFQKITILIKNTADTIWTFKNVTFSPLVLVFGTPLLAFISKKDRKIQAPEVPKTACTIVANYDTFSGPDCIKSYSLSEKKILPALMLLLLESNFFF